MTEVTYNEFRGLHKGTPQKKVSKLWNKYKDGKYKLPKQVTPIEEITVPVGVVGKHQARSGRIIWDRRR